MSMQRFALVFLGAVGVGGAAFVENSKTMVTASGELSPADPCAGASTVPALVTVKVVDQQFLIRVTDQALLEEMIDICQGHAPQKIVVGTLRTGNDGYNHDPLNGTVWSWHLREDSIKLAEVAVEVCDGLPSFVEGPLEYWHDMVRHYCPWSSRIVAVGPDTSLPGDFDLNGVVDHADYAALGACFSGPSPEGCSDFQFGKPPCPDRCFEGPAGCCATDMNDDPDIDVADYAAFQEAFAS
ncbi:MAG: hypothetical protein JXB13_18050 [Phycisphaerae bacterium]|nr:hypothetical protein [Phycisphaerae bacterium]